MESVNSSSSATSNSVEAEKAISEKSPEQWFNEQFDNLLPKIQERWPDLAKQTLEATKGSLEDLINVISIHSGKNSFGVQEQLEEIFHSATDTTRGLAETLEPLEKQLDFVCLCLGIQALYRSERPSDSL